MSRTALLLLCVSFLASVGCGGDIKFGEDQKKGDGGPSADGGTDAGARDAGPPPPDAGTCTPSYPEMWPLARDAATYRAKFHDKAVADGCPACHLSVATIPLIPPSPAALDDTTTLNDAINALWMVVKPGGTEALLIKWHSPMSQGGLGQAPIFTPEQAARYTEVVRDLGCR